MHVFEYMCSSCLKDFDVMELSGLASFMVGCPHCGGRDLKFKFDRLEALAKKRDPAPEDEPGDKEKDQESEEGEEEDSDELEDGEAEDGEDFPGPSELN
jgi:predicted  nucleic acid-binding Zn-ribbon protein